MVNNSQISVTTSSTDKTERFGELLAMYLKGGDVLELVGDLGAGKTQLVRGLARGVKTNSTVQSPSFMLQRIYDGEPYAIHHFDFYRLHDPGILLDELRESLDDNQNVVAIEWARSSKQLLPDSTVTITITPTSETERTITVENLKNAEELTHDFNN
jgi:tRNA threonylcarbamoyladenosine biosynthesis protein TsaE